MAGKNKLEETLIQVGLRIAKRGEGAIFVVGKTKYQPMIEQTIPKFLATNNPKLLESLALIDGAVIIDKQGYVCAYGVKIKSNKIFKNYGTRHSAALGASDKNFVVLVSEEDKKLKILRNGKLIMQIDSLQKNIEKSVDGAVNLLESVGAGAIGTIGTSLLVPTLGISILPGILVFGSAYYIGKILHNKLNRY
jgi:hypothetical protein